ncbi:hypothetical protein P171DRAFT_423951 [Karstenula rhodostoma CBS 690.94]|uniref:GDP/GTP exchange factor Sec2 N-terminal domain-containing protein n=1 Tax=Karstenula rhodostoma CBS 690.94 TaxID=1392251 RepID=A0A9P4P858_9PLEO|nr:hypothetical protein P171DRAFT_423951 [Karstenula rhodostoma CBS 690.94]
MAADLVDEAGAPSITAQGIQRGSCLSCGADLDPSEAEEAQKRIKELESQVELLTEKATAAGTWVLCSAYVRSTDPELLEQLEKERALRAKAEEKARKVDSEIEELSVQLFSQANEMVAQERKARAKLEARVEVLEKKDKDKMARLERLEKAVSRIDRVKALLAAPVSTAVHRKI